MPACSPIKSAPPVQETVPAGELTPEERRKRLLEEASVQSKRLKDRWLSSIEGLKQSQAKLDFLAMHDMLTGLPNRVQFHLHLERELARASRGQPIAILFLDLDRFKTVNDTLGHQRGDELLAAVAGRLKASIRKSDLVARLGGDEFAIVQTGVEQPANATALARRLIDAVAAPYELEGRQVVVGASIGIALAPGDGLTRDDLLRSADLAMYRAKTHGRGVFCFFEPAMNAEMQELHRLELDLRRAVADGQLRVFYQPLVEVASGRVAGCEALVRWQHPTRGLVLPGQFVPLAEEVGLIIPIGEWVLQQACRDAAGWPEDVRVAVNVSVAQFRSPALFDAVDSALRHSGLAADRLSLEITESLLVRDAEAALTVLTRLRGLGVRISMDDFGTGYSSLSYLRSFPFDKIKIDRSFVRDLETSESSNAIVRAIVHLGCALGMSVTAEGVETQEQFERVKAEGCTEAQGYLFGRPCQIDAIREMILHR
jgi:diguanylate cyclase (GGDEF)-like protein